MTADASVADAQCTNTLATLKGLYLASGSGDVFTTLGLIDEPDSVAAYVKFNGDGTVSKTKFSDFRNGIETEYQVTSGSYTLNSDPDAMGQCSYHLSLSLTNAANGSVTSLTYRVILGNSSNSTPPGRLVFDNTAGGADTALEAFVTNNPAACTQGMLADTYPSLVRGDNARNVKTQGIREITVDAAGNVTGTGHVSYNGTQDTEIISGTATVNTDCSVKLNVTIVPANHATTTVSENSYLRFGASGLNAWYWPDMVWGNN
jgi:hypothetical protein